MLFQTERLRIRKHILSDALFIFELLNSRGWIENIGERNVKSIEDAETYLNDKIISEYESIGYSMYAIELLSTGKIIGQCGVMKRPYLEHPDIGYALLEPHWNKAYASEACRGLVVFAKEVLQIEKLMGFVDKNNKASARILEKVGMQFVKDFYLENDDTKLSLYSN